MIAEISLRDDSERLQKTDYTLGELFDRNVFGIPHYQRFYSWEKSEWTDLWSDLSNNTDSSREHYMGTVICQLEPNPVRTHGEEPDYHAYTVVDGQQRLTTLVLLIHVITSALDRIDLEELSEEASVVYDEIPVDTIQSRFVSDTAIRRTGTQKRYKLRLQDDDDDIFRSILRDDLDETATETPSQGRLADAVQFYRQKLELRRSKRSDEAYFEELRRLLSEIVSLRFVVYTVEDPEEATLIFESINDRGVGLSNLDKTKSFLMHKVYLEQPRSVSGDVTIDGVQDRFGQIYRWMQDIVEANRVSDISEDQVQRYHYISTIDRDVNRAYLRTETDRRNKTLRSGSRKKVYLSALKWHFAHLQEQSELDVYDGYSRSCIEEIDEYTDSLTRYYSHMETIGGSNLSGQYDPEIDWELRKIFALDRVGNFYPLLLAVWDEYHRDRLSRASLHEILQLIEVASFRIYTTVSRSDTGRNSFYKLANSIMTAGKDSGSIIDKLKTKITSKENDFEALLRNRDAYNRIRYKDLRYLLYSYELHIRNKEGGGGETSIEKAAENAGNDYTLDHIWPNDTSQLELSEEEEEIHEEIKHILGNLTLTTGPRNSGWKNRPYHEKRERIADGESGYRNSDFTITRRIGEKNKEWGQEAIQTRLQNIVDFAKKRWSLDAAERVPLATIRPSEVD